MPGGYYIKTFGCQMNEYDSTRMGDVREAGASLTQNFDPPLRLRCCGCAIQVRQYPGDDRRIFDAGNRPKTCV